MNYFQITLNNLRTIMQKDIRPENTAQACRAFSDQVAMLKFPFPNIEMTILAVTLSFDSSSFGIISLLNLAVVYRLVIL